MKSPVLVLTVFLFCCLSFLNAQAQKDFIDQTDSLKKIIASAEGEKKLNAYQNLLDLNYPDDMIDAKIKYAQGFAEEARKQKNLKFEIKARYKELTILFNSQKLDEYQEKAKEYMPFFKKNKYFKEYYTSYYSLLQSYGMMGDEERVIKEAGMMYNEAKAQKNFFGIAKATSMFAMVYNIEGRYDEAEKYSRETLLSAQKLIQEEPAEEQTHFLLLSTYRALINILLQQDKMDDAMSLLPSWDKQLDSYEKTFGYPCHDALMDYYDMNARIFSTSDKYDIAEAYCDSVEQMNPEPSMTDRLNEYRSMICEGRGEYEKALYWIDKVIDFNTQIGELTATVIFIHNKGRILCKMGRGKEGWLVYDRAMQLNDSLRKADNNAQLDDLRTKYDVDKLTAEKRIAQQRWIIALITSVLLLILLTIYYVYSRRLKRKNLSLFQQIQEITQKEKAVEQCLLSRPEESLSKEMQLFRRLSNTMHNEKLFTDPELNRKKLADHIGTNEMYLADAIKEATGETFSSYISNLRLQYAIELFNSSPQLTLDAVAVDSGHGSYSPFYRSFIKKYGITPSEYRKLALTTVKA